MSIVKDTQMVMGAYNSVTTEEPIKYLGIIPARGGSKRIPRKNVKAICNKALLVWSIEAAKQSKLLNDFVVTTEDSTIATICDYNGAKVIERPQSLSDDATTLTPVLQHVLSKINAENVVILRPTSPIRINNIIDKAIKRYEEEKADSLMTGFMNKEYEWFTHPDQASQTLSGWFQGDGCVEINKSSLIKEGKAYGKKCIRYVVDDIYNHEIDTDTDFVMVAALMKHLRY